MRNWTGIHNDRTEIGDGLTMIRNVSFITNGQLQRRPQLGERFTLSAELLSSLHPRQGGDYLIAADGSGKLVSVNMADNTSTDVATGLDADIKGCFAVNQQNVYYTNDFDTVRRISTGTGSAVEAGIDAPLAAPSVVSGTPFTYIMAVVSGVSSGSPSSSSYAGLLTGAHVGFTFASGAYTIESVNTTADTFTFTPVWAASSQSYAATISKANTSNGATDGSHRFRYRYKESTTGYLSNPSAETTFSVGTSTAYSRAVIGVIASSDTKVDKIVIEATAVDGTEWYIVSTVANTSAAIDFNSSDTTLTAGLQVTAYYGEYGHEPPPLLSGIIEHRGRMFGFSNSIRTNTAVSVALSAASVTGSGFSTNWAGKLVTFVGSSSVSYVIESVSSSGTSLTLATNFAGSTSTAASMSIFSPTPDMLYWSRAGYPESWKPSAWARRVLNNGDSLTALFSSYDTLWLCGRRTLKAFDYTSDPAAARISTIPTQLGVYNQQCVINAEGRIFGFGDAGIFELKGRVPTPISTPVDTDIENLIDRDQSAAFHCTYDYFEDTVSFWFCRTGDTVAKDAAAYHLPTGEWQLRTWRQGIKCSTVAGAVDKSPRPYLGCENGYVWRVADDRVADGLPTSLTTGVVTVDASATTTSIPVTEALPTGSSDLAGMMLYNPTSGTAKAITSNTATTITCAAFSAAPSQGTSLYLGSIDVYLKSEWWPGPSPHALKRPPYLMFEHVSDATTIPEATLQVFKDLSDTAIVWTKGSGDVSPNGVTTTNNSASATIDFDFDSGIIYAPLFDINARYWRYTLTQDKPAGTLKLMDVKFLLQNRGDIDSKVKPV